MFNFLIYSASRQSILSHVELLTQNEDNFYHINTFILFPKVGLTRLISIK